MTPADFDALVRSRSSVRGFTREPVPRAVVEDLLRQARTAPSGANLQPGRFLALAGDELRRLIEALAAAIGEGRPEVSEYSYFPETMPPYLKRRQIAAGAALYDAVGVPRRDAAARLALFERNYRFFGAPVGIVVTIERSLGKGCFMDLGMAIQTLLLAAKARGLAACGIGALANRGDVVHRHLRLPAAEIVVCGIALGRADPNHPANRFRTTRLPLEEFADLRGFES